MLRLTRSSCNAITESGILLAAWRGPSILLGILGELPNVLGELPSILGELPNERAVGRTSACYMGIKARSINYGHIERFPPTNTVQLESSFTRSDIVICPRPLDPSSILQNFPLPSTFQYLGSANAAVFCEGTSAQSPDSRLFR